MKPFLLLIFIGINLILFAQGTSCATAIPIANGACLTNQNFPGSVNMAGLCVGGNNPALYISFTAGSCSQFTITSSASISVMGGQILTNGCASVSGSLECYENVVANSSFSLSGINLSGSNLLTPGTTYILRLYGAIGSNTVNICYNANTPEQPSNECVGAIGLSSSSPTNLYNGGDCSYSGSYDDASAVDPTASWLCAGSLENTQWVKFMPAAGATSFNIMGYNITCTGGGCGFQFGIVSGNCASFTNEGCYGNKVCSGGQSSAGPTNVAGGLANIVWTGTSSTGFTATFTPTTGSAFLGTESFYLVMDGNADASCHYTLEGFNIQPLPMELMYFSVLKYENANWVEWEVASQLNNAYFEVEYSTDYENWEVIKKINGSGTSQQQMKYAFADSRYHNKINYYRLSQTDYDGKKSYSQIVSVDNRKDAYIVRTINSMGIEVPSSTSGMVIHTMSDGSILKTFNP